MIKVIGDGPTEDAPKIEFPCDYPIKVVGRQSEDFESIVLSVIKQHAELSPGTDIEPVPSSKGTFVSLRLSIIATGELQLKSMYEALMATGRVTTVI